MLVTIDESGEPSLSMKAGASSYLALGMAVFQNNEEAERAAQAIKKLSKNLGLRKEFKFSNCKPEYKDAFFECIRPFEFDARVIISIKSKVYSPHLISSPSAYYNFLLKNLMLHKGKDFVNATVKIDGRGTKQFRKELTSYLRREVGSGKVAKIKEVDSQKDVLIQLADMITGAVARSYRKEITKDQHRWRQMIRSQDVWEFN